MGASAEAVRVRPDDPQAWYDRGIAFGNINRDEDALECFERAIQLKRDYAEAWNKKGVVLDHLDRLDEGLQCFEEALRLKPDFPDAWDNKGVALGNLGNDKKRFNASRKQYGSLLTLRRLGIIRA